MYVKIRYLLTQDGGVISIQLTTANLPQGLNLTCVIDISTTSSIAVSPENRHVQTFRAAAVNINESEGSLQCPMPNEETLLEEGNNVVQQLHGLTRSKRISFCVSVEYELLYTLQCAVLNPLCWFSYTAFSPLLPQTHTYVHTHSLKFPLC